MKTVFLYLWHVYIKSNDRERNFALPHLKSASKNPTKNGLSAEWRNSIPSADKIYQWDVPEVAVLKRSPKGTISSSFSRAPCTEPSISKKSTKMQYFGILFQVLTTKNGLLS